MHECYVYEMDYSHLKWVKCMFLLIPVTFWPYDSRKMSFRIQYKHLGGPRRRSKSALSHLLTRHRSLRLGRFSLARWLKHDSEKLGITRLTFRFMSAMSATFDCCVFYVRNLCLPCRGVVKVTGNGRVSRLSEHSIKRRRKWLYRTAFSENISGLLLGIGSNSLPSPPLPYNTHTPKQNTPTHTCDRTPPRKPGDSHRSSTGLQYVIDIVKQVRVEVIKFLVRHVGIKILSQPDLKVTLSNNCIFQKLIFFQNVAI